MNLQADKRIVLTLDAGGTNLVFNAIRGGDELFTPFRIKSKSASLDEILQKIIDGFQQVKRDLPYEASAISFCFPGPADYPNGIIGDLQNLPLFRGGVALKAMLEEQFGIPVFINNDGDLFTFGEAISGLLPEINRLLENSSNPRRYKNLFGITLGTGFGGGMVFDGKMFQGDNSTGGEINRLRNKLYPETSAEDSVTIRAIKRIYQKEAGIEPKEEISPKTIADIAEEKATGNKRAAILAYEELGIVAGDALADTMTLFDGLVVIGGGLSKAHKLFIQTMVDEMNAPLRTLAGEALDRMEVIALNLENPVELDEFLRNRSKQIRVPFSKNTVTYDPSTYIGVGVSRLGTSKAVSIGAYAFALDKLDSN